MTKQNKEVTGLSLRQIVKAMREDDMKLFRKEELSSLFETIATMNKKYADLYDDAKKLRDALVFYKNYAECKWDSNLNAPNIYICKCKFCAKENEHRNSITTFDEKYKEVE